MEDFEFEACVRQIQDGDKNGLKQIYQAYGGLMYAVIYDMTGQREDAQDLVSDFFIRLWDRADTYRFGGKHKAWLMTIARNMTIDFLRKQRREIAVEELPPVQEEGVDFTEEVVGNLSLREAMSLLKPGEAEVIDLKVLGGFTFQEIAKMTEKPMGTVSWLYRQGIKKLRKAHDGDNRHPEKRCRNE